MKPDETKRSSLPIWLFVIAVFAIVVVGLLLPALPRVRTPSLRTMNMNIMRQMALAIHNYEDANGHLPPPYSVDENGTPLHSWRVLILPFIEQQHLYEMIDLSKPWNHPVNEKFHDKMPLGYRQFLGESPFANQTTTFVAIVGDETVWRPNQQTTLEDLEDGTSNTLLIVQSEQHRVHWMSPFDPSFDEIIAMGPNDKTNMLSGHTGGAIAVTADGCAHFIASGHMTADYIRSLATIAGGEIVDMIEGTLE